MTPYLLYNKDRITCLGLTVLWKERRSLYVRSRWSGVKLLKWPIYVYFITKYRSQDEVLYAIYAVANCPATLVVWERASTLSLCLVPLFKIDLVLNASHVSYIVVVALSLQIFSSSLHSLTLLSCLTYLSLWNYCFDPLSNASVSSRLVLKQFDILVNALKLVFLSIFFRNTRLYKGNCGAFSEEGR